MIMLLLPSLPLSCFFPLGGGGGGGGEAPQLLLADLTCFLLSMPFHLWWQEKAICCKLSYFKLYILQTEAEELSGFTN